MSDGFTGFPREAFTFFATLAKHNDREWFHAHKDVYERCCREPMKALMAAIDPPLGAGWMSRINNDMRFNRDRAPYKTCVTHGFVVDLDGKKISKSSEYAKQMDAMHFVNKHGADLVNALLKLLPSGYSLHCCDEREREVRPFKGRADPIAADRFFLLATAGAAEKISRQTA